MKETIKKLRKSIKTLGAIRFVSNCLIFTMMVYTIIKSSSPLTIWFYNLPNNTRVIIWILIFLYMGASNMMFDALRYKRGIETSECFIYCAEGIIFVILYNCVSLLIIHSGIQYNSILMAMIFIPLGAICVGLFIERYRKKWRTQFRYMLLPGDSILFVSVMSMVIAIILMCIYNWLGNNKWEPVYIALCTGVAVSGCITVFTEISNNYKNNKKRIMVLNDYYSVVLLYEKEKTLYKNALNRKKERGEIVQILNVARYHDLCKKLEPNDRIYEGIEYQAIANQIMKIKSSFEKAINNNANLLYRDESECIMAVLESIDIIKVRLAKIFQGEYDELYSNIKEIQANAKTLDDLEKIAIIRTKIQVTENEILNMVAENLYSFEQDDEIMVLFGALEMIDVVMKKLINYVKDEPGEEIVTLFPLMKKL